MSVLPVFQSQYSLGKSILTLAAPNANGVDENSPVSVFDIAVKHELPHVVIVDDSISGFLEANQNAKKAKVKLTFGVRLRCIEDITNKSETSLKTLHKVIVLIKNPDGYADLIKITSCAAKAGFYYKPNIDFTHLKALWTPNLLLVIPFYDSFLFMNALHGHLCVPNFAFAEPTFFLENSGLPFDGAVQRKVKTFASSIQAPIVPTRTICYYKQDDFLSYLTFRCIHSRTAIEKPELEHCSSNKFSFEHWEEQNYGRKPVEI